MNGQRADLHTHSLASDGTQPSSYNVRMAKQIGLAAIAITDHDTTAGIEEALEEGRRQQLTVVPGVEISTVAGDQDIHVLGYFIDYRDPLFLSRLEKLRRTRDRRNEMLIAKLQQLGLQVTMEEVIANLDKPLEIDETIGRPHIAALLLKKGYVSSIRDAFDRYLGREGAAYVNPPRIHPKEAIDWIHEARGAAVVAHPGLYDDDPLVLELVRYGLDGIEAFHTDHSPEQESKYEALAKEHGLIVTGGSDYHGERGGEVFHGPIGHRTVEFHTVEELNARKRGLQ